MPWGMPFSFGEVLQPHVSEVPQYAVHFLPPDATTPQATMTFSAPVVHAIPQDNGPIIQSGSVGAYDRMDDLQKNYDEINREVKALCGKELFTKNAYDLCLAPNVKIPHKFKLPDFKNYKGNIFPKSHLVMYARKMST
jgi:hypothetical protein